MIFLKPARNQLSSSYRIARTAGDPPVPIPPILSDGDAILQPPLDNTPNNPPNQSLSHIPHIGHALLFVGITTVALLLTQAILPSAIHSIRLSNGVLPPKLLLSTEAITYTASITAAWFVFPLLWRQPFSYGLRWNPSAAMSHLAKLVTLGVALSLFIQAASSFFLTPKSVPMDKFFHTPSDVWMITVFGILLAPLFEEIMFRGFFFPAFATAYDWLCLPRTEAALETWQSSNAHTSPALIFSAVLTSVLFALLHGEQTAFTWPVLGLLFLVSLILTAVRLRLRSVTASAIVHASYNLVVFVAAFIVTSGYRHLDRLSH